MEQKKIHLDSYYTIGNAHNYCQDYAKTFEILDSSGLTWQISALSDGCSGAPDTDIGSRFMVYGLKSWFSLHWLQQQPDENFNFQKYARYVYEQSQCLFDGNSLTATLLMAITNDKSDKVIVHVCGDGALFIARNNGQHEFLTFDYNNLPLYPIYLKSQRLYDEYVSQHDTKNLIIARYNFSSDFKSYSQMLPESIPFASLPSAYSLTLDKSDVKSIFLFSDGISSFSQQGNQTNPAEMITKFLPIKTFQGEYLVRRSKKFLKEMTKDGCFHQDDFSVAGMIFED